MGGSAGSWLVCGLEGGVTWLHPDHTLSPTMPVTAKGWCASCWYHWMPQPSHNPHTYEGVSYAPSPRHTRFSGKTTECGEVKEHA